MSSISLEEIVKNNLGHYEARYDANDWGRMEAMLGTTTDSRAFNWKPLFIIFIVLGVLGGGYVLFTNIDFSKPVTKESIPGTSTPAPAPTVVKKTVTPPEKKNTPPPVIIRPINVDSIKKVLEDARIAKEEEDRKAIEDAAKEEARLKKERKREEPTKEELEAREARRAKRRALADSNKTKEDSSKVKEPRKEKSKSSGIGLNIFSTFNADSLKKYQEKLKKDSVK